MLKSPVHPGRRPGGGGFALQLLDCPMFEMEMLSLDIAFIDLLSSCNPITPNRPQGFCSSFPLFLHGSLFSKMDSDLFLG